MASTARLFFQQSNARGGFSKEAYQRDQGSNSSCALPSACMWLTIKLQRNNPEKKLPPVDIGWFARRYVIGTREGLENRVINDNGEDPLQLLYDALGPYHKFDLIDCDFSRVMIEKPNFYMSLRKLEEGQLKLFLDVNEVGLVRSFDVCENFRKVTRSERFGYYKFDGDSIDCEAEFVEMPPDAEVERERQRLYSLWQRQLQHAEDSKKQQQNSTNALMAISPRRLQRDDGIESYIKGKDFESNMILRVESSSTDTVDQLRAKVEQKLDSSRSIQNLTYKGRALDNPKYTLQEYRIENKDVIQVQFADAGNDRIIKIFFETRITHAMVLIGDCTEVGADGEERRFYMLWNWWTSMPLVRVSFEYLMACHAKIHFLSTNLTPDCINGMQRTEALACDCAFADCPEDKIKTIVSHEASYDEEA